MSDWSPSQRAKLDRARVMDKRRFGTKKDEPKLKNEYIPAIYADATLARYGYKVVAPDYPWKITCV